MLDTDIYNQDLQLIVSNSKSAIAHGDRDKADAILDHLLNLLQYAGKHGLTLDTVDGRFQFKRNGYAPDFLYINVGDGSAIYIPPLTNRAKAKYERMRAILREKYF